MDISKLEVGKIDLLTDYISINQIPSSWIDCFYEILSYYEFDGILWSTKYKYIETLDYKNG